MYFQCRTLTISGVDFDSSVARLTDAHKLEKLHELFGSWANGKQAQEVLANVEELNLLVSQLIMHIDVSLF
jgi:hypothetical protein